MPVGIKEATGFFDLMLLKRKKELAPDWPSLDHLLIPEPMPAGDDGIGGLAKTSHGPYLENRTKSFPPKP